MAPTPRETVDPMLEWSDDQREYRTAVRRFVEREIAPRREALEHEGLPPYEVLRDFYREFGLRQSALDRVEARLAGIRVPSVSAAERIIPLVEFARHSPGLVTALGTSVDLTAGAILRAGTPEQIRRWVPDLVTLDKIGAWAITEAESGSDAFGSMRATARPVDGGWRLTGAKTFISNAPYADTIVFICKLDDGRPPAERPVVTFVLDRDLPGLEVGAPLRKMGLRSSPTGEVFVDGVVVGEDRLLAHRPRAAESPGRESSDDSQAKAAFAVERASIAATAFGIIERCHELSIEYARSRVQFGRRIGDYQLIQLKLARMEVARMNTENLVLQYIAMADVGRRPSLAQASAIKLYTAQAAVEVGLEAVQVFGGNGYMSENHVEQLCRDSKVLQIFAGTDEMQVRTIARALLDG
jgi:hypothetical protein